MASLRPVAIIIFSLVALSAQQGNGTSEGITCYDWGGNGYTNNTQCPGSRVCCHTADLCTPNRFCVANGQTIVPACAVYPWSDCSNICQYGTSEYSDDCREPFLKLLWTYKAATETGTGFLPRVVTCSDGSFCCDNDPTCCAENRGIVLNGLGAIVSTDDGIVSTSTSTSSTTIISPTTTSSTTSASSTSSFLTATVSSSLTTPTSTQSILPQSSTSTIGLTSGAKVGIGIGAAGGAVALAVLAYLLRRHRRRSQEPKATPMTARYRHELDHSEAGLKPYSMPYTQKKYSPPVEIPATYSAIYEMPVQNSPRA